MEKTSFKDYGITIESGANDENVDVSSVESTQSNRDGMLLFPKFGVVPEHEDQLEAVNTDPTAMLKSLKASNITIEDISDDDKKKFGLMDHPLHEEHLGQAA